MHRPASLRGVHERLSYPSPVIRGRSVALVGNGPTALGKRWGPDVDSHQTVVRINAGAPDARQYRELGARTTVLAVATRRCLDVSMRHLGHAPRQVWWMKRTRLGWRELERVLGDDGLREVLWVWPQKWENECREYVGAPPSTGMRLAWACRQVWGAGMVSLIGFDCWDAGESWWYSARPEAVLTRGNPHDGAKERDALTRLGYGEDRNGWLRWGG